jgi:hypothetical protein
MKMCIYKLTCCWGCWVWLSDFDWFGWDGEPLQCLFIGKHFERFVRSYIYIYDYTWLLKVQRKERPSPTQVKILVHYPFPTKTAGRMHFNQRSFPISMMGFPVKRPFPHVLCSSQPAWRPSVGPGKATGVLRGEGCTNAPDFRWPPGWTSTWIQGNPFPKALKFKGLWSLSEFDRPF